MRGEWIVPDWPAPAKVRAMSTTRLGGVSTGVYASLNLGLHVGDAAESVAENRQRLRAELDLHKEPHWLKQTHSAHVATIGHLKNTLSPAAVGERGRVRGSAQATQAGNLDATAADAAITQSTDEVCAIMTADCLPVLFCDRAGTTVAAAHAGWRGMSAGVLEATVAAMAVAPGDLLVWLGPAIGPQAYEVGAEVQAAFVRAQAAAAGAFRAGRPGKWFCDLYALARLRLQSVGVRHIYGGGFCTFTESRRFFSYRRDGECGRMATLIWLVS